jgi:GNAT superfamily N-acetyltransferase
MAEETIRRARAEEAASLSALAMRAKAHWGYDPQFLASVRPLLTLSAHDIEAGAVYVLEGAGAPIGVYRVLVTPPRGTLEDLWLEPRVIGSGRGRRLFDHALGTAASLGCASLTIEADPHAEGFYLAMGAVRIGARASASGRSLPLLQIATGASGVRAGAPIRSVPG